jgi:hypothetical protein
LCAHITLTCSSLTPLLSVNLFSLPFLFYLPFLSLPLHSLNLSCFLSASPPFRSSLLPSSPLVTADSKNEDFYSDITEPSGWNETLDQAWRGAVQQAVSPTILMECVLLLEHYLNKAWLQVESGSNCFLLFVAVIILFYTSHSTRTGCR